MCAGARPPHQKPSQSAVGGFIESPANLKENRKPGYTARKPSEAAPNKKKERYTRTMKTGPHERITESRHQHKATTHNPPTPAPWQPETTP